MVLEHWQQIFESWQTQLTVGFFVGESVGLGVGGTVGGTWEWLDTMIDKAEKVDFVRE